MTNKIDHQYLVVGNGPTASQFIQRMVQNNIEICHINSNIPIKKNKVSYLNFNQKHNQIWKYSKINYQTNKFNKYQKFTNFIHFGSGGLSSTWGAGCSKYTESDIGINKKIMDDIKKYYPIVEKNIGIYYQGEDLLESYLGKFNVTKDNEKYPEKDLFSSNKDITFGFARKAIKNKSNYGRNPANNSGGSFIDATKGMVYDASNSLDMISSKINTLEGFKLISFRKNQDGSYRTIISNDKNQKILNVKYLILGLGTISTAEVTLNYLKSEDLYFNQSIPLLHNPTIRTIFFRFNKYCDQKSPSGLLIAKSKINNDTSSYTSFTFGSSVTVSDILTLLPFKNKVMCRILRKLRKHIFVTMTFYPSSFSNIKIQLNNKFEVKGAGSNILSLLKPYLRFLFKLIKHGSIPILVTKLPDGSDLHHGGTFPMGDKENFNVNNFCELNNHKNLFIIDGSWMPKIPEKPHTFTLMANAIRIADHITDKNK